MWHLGTCFSGGLGIAGSVVGRDDLKGLFQHSYNYMILRVHYSQGALCILVMSASKMFNTVLDLTLGV